MYSIQGNNYTLEKFENHKYLEPTYLNILFDNLVNSILSVEFDIMIFNFIIAWFYMRPFLYKIITSITNIIINTYLII